MKYILWLEDRESEPYNSESIHAAIEAQKLSPKTLARLETATNWMPLELLLPRRPAPRSEYSPQKPSPNSSSSKSKYKLTSNDIIIIVIGALILICAFLPKNNGTDGVYESAVEKMNKGIPLNDREAQRVHDILNYKQDQQSKEIEEKHGE